MELLPGAERVEHEGSLAVWAAIRDAVALDAAPGDAVWRASVRPSRGPGVVDLVEGAGGRCFLDWGGGLVWVAGAPALHGPLTAAVRAAGGVWTVMRGPDPMRAAVDVVPREPEPLARIARRVKAAMDPAGILNPGRIAAGA